MNRESIYITNPSRLLESRYREALFNARKTFYDQHETRGLFEQRISNDRISNERESRAVDRNWTRIVYVMISVNCFDSRRLLAETKSPSKLFECATTTRRQHANPTQTRVQLTGDPKL